jgi:hypothetical protein
MADSMTIAEILEPMEALVRARPGFVYHWRTRQLGDRWVGDIKAGFAEGAKPWWTGSAATQHEALAQAVDHAHSYWGAVSVRMGPPPARAP